MLDPFEESLVSATTGPGSDWLPLVLIAVLLLAVVVDTVTRKKRPE